MKNPREMYVLLENYNYEEPGVERDMHLNSFGQDGDFVDGISHDFQEILQSLPAGYYLLRFSLRTTRGYEGWEETEVEEIDLIPAPIRGRAFRIFHQHLRGYWYAVCDLFRPIWGVEVEYGGVGIRDCGDSYLPQALWGRFFRSEYKWGAGWTRRSLRK